MISNFLNGGLLNAQSKTITLSAVILAVSAVASRLLGIWRDWLISGTFGAGPDADVYFAAFRIPDFIYNILIFGGIVVAFLPLFSEYYQKDKKEAWRFANNTLNVFLAFLVGLCLILFVFTPQLVAFITPGFDAQMLAKTAMLTRLMFLSPIIFGAASIYSGILQYFKRFVAFSFAPALYNLGIIAGILLFASSLGIMSAAVGVVIGALMYLLIQVPPAIKCGFCYAPVFDLKARSLARVFKLMIPRTFGIAANQINQVVTTSMASLLSAGSIAIFNLSNNLFGIPVGIFGISYAMAAFPEFSKFFVLSNMKELAGKFSLTFRQVVYIVTPLSFLMFGLRDTIVSLIYYHGKFTYEAFLLTSASLGVFCVGIYFASVMPVLFRLFFAFQDTKSPTISTIVSVTANILLNFFFIGLLASNGAFPALTRRLLGLPAGMDISVLGLAFAYTLANVIQFAVLEFLLYKKMPKVVETGRIWSSFAKALIASIIMFIAVSLIHATIRTDTILDALIGLGLASAAGTAVYLAMTALIGSPELGTLRNTLPFAKRNAK